MNSQIVRFTAAVVLLLFAGCAAQPIEREFAFAAEPGEGVVFLSLSHDLSGGRGTKAIFYLDGGPVSGGTMVFSLREAFPGINAGSEFKDSYGQLVALALPAGKHRFDSWQIYNGRGLRIFPAGRPPPLEFTVQAGQARYLGNLHANLQAGRGLFGVNVVFNGNVEVRDRRDRDVEVFERKYPQFKGKALMEPFQPGSWTGGGGTRTQIDPPPPVTPLPTR
jgi:hypothetical protein